MKKPFYKSFYFWSIFLSFIISLLIIFLWPYLFDNLKTLSSRLLLSSIIMSLTIITILLIIVFKKPETKEILEDKKRKKELENEFKKLINTKVSDLKNKFKEAIKIIKKSSLYKNKRRAKYELPWYLVLGDKNEGKTTLLESSGLSFPLNVNYDTKSVVEESNSQNFQWFYAEHSIFIDVPGNYIEQKENKEDPFVWEKFLNLFVKKRWRRPINGIILTISIDKLIDYTEKELEQYAKDLRDRFDELSLAFMSSIPIYLIITKSDKIEGFNEYFNDLKEDEKDEILGITFDDKEKNIDTAIVKPQLEALLKRLNSSILTKLHYEWEENNRPKTYLFTNNLSKVFEKTTLFIDMCFAQTRYRKPLMLRGLYFTSVPCEDNHNALITEEQLEYSRNKKGLFIKKLLNDIIFPESEILKMDENYKKKFKKNQIIAYAASFIFVIFTTIYMLNDFISHNNTLKQIEKDYLKYQINRKKVYATDSFDQIAQILNNLKNIENLDKEKIGNNFYNLIFFKVDNRREFLEKIYYEDLTNLLLKRVELDIQSQIKDELNNFDSTWENTKAYVMLNRIDKLDKVFLEEYMAKRWNILYKDYPSLQNNLNYHWMNILNKGFIAQNLNNDLLKVARNRLMQFGIDALSYKSLKAKVENLNLRDFSFSQIFETPDIFNGADLKINGLFTKEGHNLMMKEGRELTKQVLQNNWVLGKKSQLTQAQISESYKKILSLYYSEYKKEWLKAITMLNIPNKSRITELNNQLSIFSSATSPIYNIINAIKENTDIYTPEEKLKLKAKSNENVTKAVATTVAPGRIGRALAKNVLEKDQLIDNKSIKNLREFFKPYVQLLDENDQPLELLSRATAKLDKVYKTMISLDSSVNSTFEALRLVKDRVEGRVEPIVVTFNSLPIHVNKWYKQLLQNNWYFILSQAKNYMNKKYKEDVYLFYEQKLASKYPIYNTKSDYIKLEDFNDFFKKDGIIDTFYKNYVSLFININKLNNTYKINNLDGTSISVNKTFIDSLLKSFKVKKAFFRNSGSLGFTINIKPYVLGSNLATMQLTYNGNTIYYEHGPIKNQKINWPANSLDSVVKFNLYNLKGKQVISKYLDNDWAILQVFNNFKVKKESNDSVIIKYEDKKYTGSFIIKGETSQAFTKYNYLSTFKLPKGI
ncbi:type VI secretion system membrane subunit TssM [Malaciobacter molluscorum]|uniref:type VI secretion system membrane subunit TssM n=1 Tax=Malaciobacter molluscorum TaxID=1032072 RepID=UPI00100B9FFF|nr:type VI secretion system membrane subunit TssM [Malaciobacter molluscorum]RXJ93903.1 type VI secretion system membrane subunit TssM [Malaciobacter molluscorum]